MNQSFPRAGSAQEKRTLGQMRLGAYLDALDSNGMKGDLSVFLALAKKAYTAREYEKLRKSMGLSFRIPASQKADLRGLKKDILARSRANPPKSATTPDSSFPPQGSAKERKFIASLRFQRYLRAVEQSGVTFQLPIALELAKKAYPPRKYEWLREKMGIAFQISAPQKAELKELRKDILLRSSQNASKKSNRRNH